MGTTWVGRALVALLGALLLALALVALVAPRSPFTVYRQPVVVAATVVLLLVSLLWRPPARLCRWCAWRWSGLLVAALAGVVAMVTGQSMRLRYSWDVRITMDVAARLDTGAVLTPHEVSYASRYPNNAVMIGVDRLAYRVADATGWRVDGILVAVAAVGAMVAVWAVHRMVLPVGGPVRAVGAQLVTTLLVAASPWVAIPYTDILAVPFLSVGLLLAMTAMRRRQDGRALLLAVAAGASVGVAAVLKTIPYVVVGALVLTGVLAAVAARADRRVALRWLGGAVVAAAAVVVTALGTTSVVAGTALADVPTSTDASAPVLWWLANGMTTTKSPGNPPRYGGFNASLGKAISGMTRAEASDWAAGYIRGKWAKRGLVGMAGFYAAKAAWNWGDGMFWAWGEGQDAKPNRLPPAAGVAAAVRAVDRPEGRWYATRSDLTQAVWLTVLGTLGLGALLTRSPRPEVLLLAVSVLGLMVFTLLFQGRSRYLFTFVPLVVTLAAMVHPGTTPVRARLVGARAGAVSRRRSASEPP